MAVTKAELIEVWNENEQYMGDQAAFAVTCEQLGLTEEEAYLLLAED